MTTPSQEKLRPSPPYRYAELSAEHLAKAAAALDKDDALQASEEIWDAVASALKAVCQERGWNHRYHNHLRAAAYYLAEEWRRPDFNANFRAFEDLHTNNYEHQDFVPDVLPMLALARDFCQSLEQIRQTPPPDWNSFSPQQQRVFTHRLRELTRQLPDRAAFGAKLRGILQQVQDERNDRLQQNGTVKPPHIREV